jgi:GMP synthase (glutamine-hydrolysing)
VKPRRAQSERGGQRCGTVKPTRSDKPFLVLQLRPETEAADNEFDAILAKGGIGRGAVRRVRLDREPEAEIDLDAVAGVIVGGGPGCVSDAPEAKPDQERAVEEAMMRLMPAIVERDLPFLGCCYGIGILAHHLGAPVAKDRWGEAVGTAECRLTEAGRDDPLLAGLPERFLAFVGHKEAVQALPEGCVHLVEAPTCPFQMIRYGQNVYATQFHPEADSAVFALRIRIYRDAGYFEPDDAERLAAACRAADVSTPEIMLRRFVERYRTSA